MVECTYCKSLWINSSAKWNVMKLWMYFTFCHSTVFPQSWAVFNEVWSLLTGTSTKNHELFLGVFRMWLSSAPSVICRARKCYFHLYPVYLLFHRRMMTLRKVTSQSTRGLLPPSTSPRWTPRSQRSCSSCPRRARLWWCLPQWQGIPLRKRRRRSQACGRAASSTPTLIFRGSYSLRPFYINKNFV